MAYGLFIQKADLQQLYIIHTYIQHRIHLYISTHKHNDCQLMTCLINKLFNVCINGETCFCTVKLQCYCKNIAKLDNKFTYVITVKNIYSTT